ncbi:MAG: hypothetical protein KJN89_04025 [Gammaproteobacteria bacterium]|nr:hypothetical protein [Gammaproteobacteria bacterium]MBT8134923.1 hypothetical protein [Gammaproteobacteria bacterium]NNJ49520.1 hypothetical protein [Gammaproteobacteria bacterium]
MDATTEQISVHSEASLRSILNRLIPKYILVITLTAIISACSLKSVYNNLDYLIPSYVEGMVSLDDILEERVEQRSQVLINWHRNTQLEQYAALLSSFQRDFGPQLTEKRVFQHMTTVKALWQPLSEKLNEEMALLLPLLNDEQLEELFDSIDEKNKEFYDEYVDLDEEQLIEEYSEKLFDNYESWLGDLTKEQEVIIEKAAYKFKTSAHLRLEQRRKWQINIRQILYSDDTADIKSERLRVFFKAFNSQREDVLYEADKANKQVIAWLTVELVHAATDEQKQHFINVTDDYIRIFTELAENR